MSKNKIQIYLGPEANVFQIVSKFETKTVETPQMLDVATAAEKARRATFPVLVDPNPPGLALSTTRPNSS